VCLSGVGQERTQVFATVGLWCPWYFGDLHISAVMQVMTL